MLAVGGSGWQDGATLATVRVGSAPTVEAHGPPARPSWLARARWSRPAQATALAVIAVTAAVLRLFPLSAEQVPTRPHRGTSTPVPHDQGRSSPGRVRSHSVPAHRPPPVATSRYLKTANPAWLARLGCVEGGAARRRPRLRDLLVVLAFGRPTHRAHGFGASLFGEGPAPLSRIRAAAQAYARAFVRCSPKASTHLRLAIGTSNFGPSVGYHHGRAWALMVNRANAWLARRGLAGRVTIAGAIDIELAWNGPRTTRAWVRGYDSAARWPFYNFGAMESCPPVGDCWGAWTLEDVWFVSWGARSAWPLPQVYTPNGSMAAQWFTLARYSLRRHRSPMRFAGVMTQRGACRQSHESCRGMDNRPHRAWRQLQRLVNSDRRTAQRIRWVTDIRWRGLGTALAPARRPPATGPPERADRPRPDRRQRPDRHGPGRPWPTRRPGRGDHAGGHGRRPGDHPPGGTRRPQLPAPPPSAPLPRLPSSAPRGLELL